VVGALAQLRHPRVVAQVAAAAWRGALRTLSLTKGLVLSWASDHPDHAGEASGSDDDAAAAKVRVELSLSHTTPTRGSPLHPLSACR
jgi:hypothetical protein